MAEWTWQSVDELSPQQIADLLNQYELLKSEQFDGPGPRCDHDVVLLFRCDLCDAELSDEWRIQYEEQFELRVAVQAELAEAKEQLARAEAKGKRMFEREHKGKLEATKILTDTLKPMLAREQKLVEALEFYADEAKYNPSTCPVPDHIIQDSGDKARAVLKEVKDG